MELERHVDGLREQLAVAADAGGDEARALAERLAAPLDAAVRLMLLNVLAAAAAEITRDLAPGSVEVRLRGQDPEFVVTSPPSDASAPADESGDDLPSAPATGGEGEVSRVNLRLSDRLKARVEQAAEREGLSINAWLVRAAASAVERSEGAAQRERPTPRGGQRHTGWGR
jgi:HicB family